MHDFQDFDIINFTPDNTPYFKKNGENKKKFNKF